MLRVLIIFLVIIAGVIIGPALVGNQGLALFQVSGYRITMSFRTFVIVEILFCILLYISFLIIKAIFTSHSRLGHWMSKSSRGKAIKYFQQAQCYLLEGDDLKALKLLAKSAKNKHQQILSNLQAAQIAINHNQLSEAATYLEKITQPCPQEYQFTFDIVELKLQLKSQQYQLATDNVEKLLGQKPRNHEVLRLAYLLFSESQNYQALIEILPPMYKEEIYSNDQLDQIKQLAYTARIKQLAAKSNIQELTKWWQEQPKAIRQNSEYKSLVESLQANQA